MLCPSDSVLERLVADQLPAQLEARIAKHLVTCPACRQKAQLAYSRLRPEVANPSDATLGADGGVTCAEPQDLHADLYRLITGDDVQASLASERTGELFRLLAATPGDAVAGAKLGRFTVRRWLGAGGFGVVFLAYDDLLHREIALKLPRAQALLHREMRRRFLREAEAAAKLHHPNIVPVFEAGVEQGVCYIASEYCPGPTLDAWYAQQAKPIAVSTAVAIVRQLAEAVEHAHQHRVLHRDIKPSNVLLELNSLHPLVPTPKITDFGLAKLIDADASMTANQGMLGTPRYMSPEQAAGDRSVTGPATDIFALGAVLYELLTGTAPYAGDDQAQTLHRLFFDRVVPPRRLRPDLPRDLEAICLKCLERKGEDRYATAQDLAEDLKRFETGHTTLARPLGRVEMLRRWTVRQPAIAALLATVGLGLLSLLAIMVVYSQSLKSFNAEIQTALDDTKRAQLAAEEQRSKLRNLLYASKIDLAHQAIKEKDLRQAFKLLGEVRSETSGVASNFVSRYLWNQVTAQGREIFKAMDDVYELQFSPGGERLAAGGADSVLRLFDSKTFTLLHSVPTEQGEINGIGFSPDEATVVTAGDDGTVRYWDFDTLAPGRVLAAHQQLAFDVAFTPDGKTLITCGDEPLIRLWNTATGEPEGVLKGHTRSVESLAITPDGLRLASASSDSTLRIWELATRQTQRILRGHTDRVVDVQFSSQGHSLLSGSLDQTVRRWRVSDGRCLQIETHLDPLTSVDFLSDDSLFVAADRGGAVHVWKQKEPKQGQKLAADPAAVPLHNWKAHAGRAWNVTPTPDRTGLVTAGADGQLYYWERPPAVEASVEIAANEVINDFAYDEKASKVHLIGSATGVRTWDLATGELTTAVENTQAVQRQPLSLCLLPDRTLLTAFSDGVVEAQDLSSGKPLPDLPRSWTTPGHVAVDDLAASSDGSRVAVFSYTHDAVRVFDRRDPRSDQTFEAYAQAMAISADGRRLAMSDGDDVAVWNIDGHERIGQLEGHRSSVTALAFSRDGRHLASGSKDRDIRIWNLDTKAYQTLSGHRGELKALTFSPDGFLLASGDERGELKFWFLAEAAELISIDAASPIRKLAFVSDGDRLAVQTTRQIRILNGTPAGFGDAGDAGSQTLGVRRGQAF